MTPSAGWTMVGVWTAGDNIGGAETVVVVEQ